MTDARDDDFAERVSTTRHERGLTQKQLAVKAGVALKTVISWETGVRTPSPANLHQLARALALDPADLLTVPCEEWTLTDLRVAAGFDQATAAKMAKLSDHRLRQIEEGVNELTPDVLAQLVLVYRRTPEVVTTCWQRSRQQLIATTAQENQ